jgi:hypothetical protein
VRKIALLLLLSVLAAGAARDTELVGITSFDVIVEQLPAEAELAGLSEQGLKQTIDSCLKTDGIVADDTTAGAFLYLKVVVMEVGASFVRPSGYIYRIDFDLRQPAYLVEHPSIVSQAVSWHDGCIGATSHSPPKLRREITATVETYAREFARDYRAANGS